jgi:hypothetical protein
VNCTYASRCLHCRREGHQVCACKCPRSSDSTDLPPRHKKPPPVVVLNPTAGKVGLAASAPRCMVAKAAGPTHPRGRMSVGSATPPGASARSTPEGSPSRHMLPSPPPPPPQEPRGDPRRRPRFELRIIPRPVVINAAEEVLSSALVATVGGTRPSLSPGQVSHHLQQFYSVDAQSVVVRRYRSGDFLLTFLDRAVADRVLHAHPPEGTGVRLIFR